MDLQKLLKIIAAVVGVVSIIFLVTIISTGDDAIKAGESASSVSTYMYVAYFILAIAVLAVVFFTVKNLVSNAAGLKNTLISIGAFVVLALICYFVLASGTETVLKDGSILTEGQSKLVGAGLYLFYALAIVAGGTMLGFGIKKMLTSTVLTSRMFHVKKMFESYDSLSCVENSMAREKSLHPKPLPDRVNKSLKR